MVEGDWKANEGKWDLLSPVYFWLDSYTLPVYLLFLWATLQQCFFILPAFPSPWSSWIHFLAFLMLYWTLLWYTSLLPLSECNASTTSSSCSEGHFYRLTVTMPVEQCIFLKVWNSVPWVPSSRFLGFNHFNLSPLFLNPRNESYPVGFPFYTFSYFINNYIPS